MGELLSTAGAAQGPEYILIALVLPFCCTVPYFLLALVTATVQARVVVQAKQRRAEAETAGAGAGFWQQYAPLILGWVLPQLLAVCLTAFLVPLVVSAASGRSVEIIRREVILSAAGFLVHSTVVTVGYIVAWMTERPILVFVAVLALPLMLFLLAIAIAALFFLAY